MMTEPRAVAVTVVALARAERFAEIEKLFAARLRAVVSGETLRAGWAAALSKVGPIGTVGEPVSEPAEAGLVRVSVPLTGEHGPLTVVMSIDDAGLMHGLRFAQPIATTWQAPSYANPELFTEQEITVGGTLTLPRGGAPQPAVVLLSGGGPFDRDATSGANKPLKDLAWGLASQGVAVARFDKATAGEPGHTIADEYVPRALAAVRLLQQQPTVDPARVFVLGHSMGGRVAPRVAAAEQSVAGMVILAGDTQPMHHAAVRVAHHLAPDSIPQTVVEAFARQAALVDSPDLSPATPATDLPFGWPASYWLDLRDDDPAATAAALDKPMLILQGGRDYQVTVEDDLAGWRARLAHRPDVVIRVYPADDHLFFPGSGPSTPAGYEAPQHVDPEVVGDIATWLHHHAQE